MDGVAAHRRRASPGYARERVRSWRTGLASSPRCSCSASAGGVGISFAVSLARPRWMPLAAYFVWLLVAMLLLRFGPLIVAAL